MYVDSWVSGADNEPEVARKYGKAHNIISEANMLLEKLVSTSMARALKFKGKSTF